MIEQVTNRSAINQLLTTPGQSIYVGFDPTADSLHVGHFLPLLMLARFQHAGHRPVVLVGGATGMIGDPSGRSSERSFLTLDEIHRNSEAVREQLAHFVSFDGVNAALMVNNADWTARISYLDWLRDVGKHFTINYMMAKESVRRRLEDREHGISYTEFSYMLLQANDFLHLFRHHNCAIQAGGSDQWGNITAGTELIRRVLAKEAFGITFPLLTTTSGEKFGKSAGNAIWLDPKRTSPYEFYQFWIRTDDVDVQRLLSLFTFLEMQEIEALMDLHKLAPEKRTAQKRLAEEMTRLVHGNANVKAAQNASEALFEGELTGFTDSKLAQLFAEVPSFTLAAAVLDAGMKIADMLVAAGAAKSKGEAQRLVEGGGVYINNKRIEGPTATVGPKDLASETMFVVRTGKKSYFLGRVIT